MIKILAGAGFCCVLAGIVLFVTMRWAVPAFVVDWSLAKLGFGNLRAVSIASCGFCPDGDRYQWVVVAPRDDASAQFVAAWQMHRPEGPIDPGTIPPALAQARADAAVSRELVAALHGAGLTHVQARYIGPTPQLDAQIYVFDEDGLGPTARRQTTASLHRALSEVIARHELGRPRIDAEFLKIDAAPDSADAGIADIKVIPDGHLVVAKDPWPEGGPAYTITTAWQQRMTAGALDDLVYGAGHGVVAGH